MSFRFKAKENLRRWGDAFFYTNIKREAKSLPKRQQTELNGREMSSQRKANERSNTTQLDERMLESADRHLPSKQSNKFKQERQQRQE